MDFYIKEDTCIIKNKLIYLKNEYSFQSSPWISCDVSFLLEDIQININSDNHMVCSVNGFHPHTCWKSKKLTLPSFQCGSLIVIGDYESGDCIRLAPTCTYSTYYDEAIGWLCIGCYNPQGESIKISNDVIFTIENRQLISLWLHPNIQ